MSSDASADALATINIRFLRELCLYLVNRVQLSVLSIVYLCYHAPNSLLPGVDAKTQFFSHFPTFSHLHIFVFDRGDHGWI